MRIPIGHKIIVASVFLSWNLFGARAEDAASLKLEFTSRPLFDPATVYKKK